MSPSRSVMKLTSTTLRNIPLTYRVNSKYVTILKPQDLQEMNKPKMWLNILNS
jgi:hypothetical protein